jgi:hypothetical protein
MQAVTIKISHEIKIWAKKESCMNAKGMLANTAMITTNMMSRVRSLFNFMRRFEMFSEEKERNFASDVCHLVMNPALTVSIKLAIAAIAIILLPSLFLNCRVFNSWIDDFWCSRTLEKAL